MFKKFGDINPITVIKPIDVDNESTKKSLNKLIKSVKNSKMKIDNMLEEVKGSESK